MLVLQVYAKDQVKVGDAVVKILKVRTGGRVQLGIEAPADVKIQLIKDKPHDSAGPEQPAPREPGV